MRPVSVRFKCFGPYMAEQFIDFEALEKSGLFLICGETGAGKTTILDAICYALYGRSSGGLRGDLSVMRCKLAEKEDETLSEFVFDSGGKRYKFVRSLKFGRKKLNDSHNCLELRGEEYVPIFENPKATNVNQKAQELIGLTYDQFRQVIILPQGQFEKLLVSDSAEKEKILVSLFHADRWQKISDEIYRRVAERDTALKQEKLQIAAKLREYGCEKLEQLEERILQDREALSNLREEVTDAEKAAAKCRENSEKAILENEAFLELSRRKKRLESLEKEENGRNAEGMILERADIARSIHPVYLSFGEAKASKLRAEGLTAQEEARLKGAEDALLSAEGAWKDHEAAREGYEQDKQQVILLKNVGGIYRALKGLEAGSAAAEGALNGAKAAVEGAKNAYLRRDAQWQSALLNQNQAMEEYRQAQALYLRGIGSILAEKLTPGAPCPVCGSREHPAPAKAGLGHVTEAELEQKNTAMTEANEAVAKAMKLRSQAEQHYTQAVEAETEAARQAAVARAELENARHQRLPGVDTQEQLEQTLTVLSRRTEQFEMEDLRVRQALEQARDRETAARSKLEAARESLAAAQVRYAAQAAAWQEALETSGLEREEDFLAADLEPEERRSRTAALMQFRADLTQARMAEEEQRRALADKTAPDMERIKKDLLETQNQLKKLSDRQLLAEDRLKTMEKDATNLRKRQETYEIQRLSADNDLEFANRLRGRSGVSLQRYVLGVMLTSITVEANRLLAKVCGGRYRLYRTDEISGSGHKGGLELEVYDSQNNQRRSVTTLSGGEKFLAALSLAIGLSTVVQAQGGGIRLGAMFIDEGFGSLDREAVQEALEVLQGIQRNAGIVGIISHVEQLAQIIPTRLEIEKGKQGSICHVRG